MSVFSFTHSTSSSRVNTSGFKGLKQKSWAHFYNDGLLYEFLLMQRCIWLSILIFTEKHFLTFAQYCMCIFIYIFIYFFDLITSLKQFNKQNIFHYSHFLKCRCICFSHTWFFVQDVFDLMIRVACFIRQWDVPQKAFKKSIRNVMISFTVCIMMCLNNRTHKEPQNAVTLFALNAMKVH